MNRPGTRECQGEDSAHGSRLHNRAESLIIINPWTLSKATEHPTSLVSLQRAMCLEFVLEYPLVGDNIGLRRTWNQIPRVISQQSIEFLLHRLAPIGISKTPTIGARHGRQRSRVVDSRQSKASLPACHHGVLVRHGRHRDSSRRKDSRRSGTARVDLQGHRPSTSRAGRTSSAACGRVAGSRRASGRTGSRPSCSRRRPGTHGRGPWAHRRGGRSRTWLCGNAGGRTWLCGSAMTCSSRHLYGTNRGRYKISVIKELKLLGTRRGGLSRHRKGVFIKDNMSRDDDAIRLEVKTTVPFVIRRIAKDDAQSGARSEFMGRSC